MDNSNTKIRPILLAKILYERTDYDHCLTTSQLIKILEEEFNVPAHRTTVTSDIELLQGLGNVVNNCIETSKQEWDSFETSWDFKKHPLV